LGRRAQAQRIGVVVWCTSRGMELLFCRREDVAGAGLLVARVGGGTHACKWQSVSRGFQWVCGSQRSVKMVLSIQLPFDLVLLLQPDAFDRKSN
jgi:hypothetical protein